MTDPPRQRFSIAPGVFHDLAARAGRRERVTYAGFAQAHDLGAPIGLSWILMPLLRWCEGRGLPPLPIIVVRARDGLPSGPYLDATIPAETERVFAHPWTEVGPPAAEELAALANRRRPLPS